MHLKVQCILQELGQTWMSTVDTSDRHTLPRRSWNLGTELLRGLLNLLQQNTQIQIRDRHVVIIS